MNVKEIMSPEVVWVNPELTINQVARKMKESEIGCLPVRKTADSALIGLITDRDITCRCVAEGRDPATATAADIMSKDVISCFDDQDVNDAAHLMGEKHIQRLPVLNRQNSVVGLLSLADLAVHAPNSLAGEVLEAVSTSKH